jgi:outer membrane receptor protein involved in Fe transport
MSVLPSRRIVLGTCTLLLLAPTLHATDSSSAASTATGSAVASGDTADSATTAASDGAGTTQAAAALPTIVVSAQRLNSERSQIETDTGASTTTISSDAISALPGGSNVQMNQVLLQAPDVVQDSFGQLHIRGDHGDLQYRLNGIILPEGISAFSQSLDPRVIASMNLLTGALPAEYGLRTAGIVNISTKGGLQQPGGSASLYGGSHSTVEPSAWYGGSAGTWSYFVSADLLRNDLGIESPDASTQPLHDHTNQVHGFGYFEDILDPDDRLSLVLGTSNEWFQIPNAHGGQPSLGLGVNGVTDYLSNLLNENQHELTEYAIASWQHSSGPLNWQSSLSGRYSSVAFEPDWLGDLLYNGIAQNAFKRDNAIAWQTDGSYMLGPSHTLRAGFYLQHDDSLSDTTSQVLPLDASGNQTSEVPLTVIDNGTHTQWIESLYLQDEWKPVSALTINYGLRFDSYQAYSSGREVSPRVNLVWQPAPATTVHAGYSRYFTPPPFELVAAETFTKFANTTALPPGSVTEDDAPGAELANYYDVGIQQKLLDNDLTLGVDSFYQQAQYLLDEGQFGAPVILTPFNFRFGKIAGIEFTGNYAMHNFSAYGNLSFQSAKGKDVVSSQFNFPPDALDYISSHYINLDHAQRVTASGGVSYQRRGTRLSLDMIFGTGLRSDLLLPDGVSIPNGDHTPSYTQWNFGATHDVRDGLGTLTLRFDIINVFDKVYEIRSGTGIGVFAPQYGARRGFFGGISQDF